MSVVIHEPEVEAPEEPVEMVNHGPDTSLLTDKVPASLRAPKVLAGMALVLGLVFIHFCSRPVWHTDVWGHLSYGRYIWETGSLPKTEPLLPLAKGMPFVDSPWLSQLIGYAVISCDRLQLAGLQGLFAVAVTWCCALLARRSYDQTRNGWFALLTIFSFLLINWMPLTVMRPQIAGLLCFVLLLTRLTGRSQLRTDWLVIPGLFVLWANLHASFFVGLGLLGSFLIGRFADIVFRRRSIRSGLLDPQVRRLFLLTELSAVAVLFNPYSLALYLDAWKFSSNENLQDLSEWHPLTLRDGEGQLLAVLALMLGILYRYSPRRIRSWELISLVTFGFASLWSARMIVWWAPLAGLLMTQHGYAVWRKWSHSPLVPVNAERTGKWSFVTIGVVWISFMITPLGVAIVHNRHSDDRRAMSEFTPRFAVEFLKKHPPQGLVFNTYEWGDYLQWAGPKDLQLFVNSHAHLVPKEVWQTYMQVIEQRSGWEEALDKYGVNTVVVDMANREPLIKKLKEDDRWQSPPEQSEGQVIFVRKKPINVQPVKK